MAKRVVRRTAPRKHGPQTTIRQGGTPANAITTLPDDRLSERRPVYTEAPHQESQEAEQREADRKLLELARKRFHTASAAESNLRLEMLEDLRFRAGKQWPDQIIADRTNEKRPILTVNRIPQFLKQILNPQRQSRPSIQVNPVGDGADGDTAEIIQGIIRHIENTSHAEVAYDEAYEDAVTMGRGWFRILTESTDDGTFDHDIVVKRVANPFSIYVDPAAQELDYSDARYMFVVEDVPKDEYEELYGDSRARSLEMFQGAGTQTQDWFPEGKVRIAEYFFVEIKKRQMALIRGTNGEPLIVPKSVALANNQPIEKEREFDDRIVHWVKMNADEVLEHKIWPGKWIPIVPILGDEIDINGVKDLVGLVRYARDPQRMYNYWVSAETEMIALAPKPPFIGAEGQFKGHEAEWKSANTRNLPYLEYVATEIGGKPVGKPERTTYSPDIAAIVQATKQADNDLKAVTGFFDASLGQAGPDQSGKAILARQKQGETANVNYIDNLGRALWHAGRIYIDLIPHVYDAPRVVHILRADDSRSKVQINQPFEEGGELKVFDVRVGRYNIVLSVGPNYTTKRQEAVASMLQLIQADPQLVAVIGDLMVGEMDWPVAKQIAARMKKMLPPQLQDDDDKSMPPQAKAVIAQMQQHMQLMAQAYQKVVELLKSKELDYASKERIALLTTQAQVAVAAMRYGSDHDRQVLNQEFERFTQQVDLLHDRMLKHDELAHDMALAAATAGMPQPQPGGNNGSGGAAPAPGAAPAGA